MSPLRTLSRALALASAAFVAACTSVGPDHVPPTMTLAAGWQQPATAGLARDAIDEQPFWRAFGDPVLTGLVEQALAQNLDLRAALARLEGARALRGVAAADRWPSLDGRAGYEHRMDSKNTPFGAFIPETNIHSIAADATWELDLWGRVRRSVEAADGELQASEADLQGAALTVATEVVTTYVDLRAAQRRLRIANENLALQERTLGLVRARLAAGLVVERDVAQAATNVESTRARLPQLQVQETAARHRLAVLLGRAPGDLPADLGPTATLPVLPARVAVGAPADLLRRRPDVRAAERRLAAEVARIGVAEAERYPRLSLGGTLGLSANSAGKVFDADSDVVAFGPSLRWNLFDGGRLRQRVAALTANAEAAQVAWEQTVLRALEEAENAMTRFVHEQERRASLQRAAGEARRAVDLAQSQYRAGLSDFQSVIDSERTVAAIEDDLVGSEAAVTTNLVAIWKAIGGGLPALPERAPAATARG
ncbi:MAG: efflux transporter outer membrane subunit [Planctomycetes bacterium]|nr:efflux transporter outer membrane subunit [Planctomycetota bacterium]